MRLILFLLWPFNSLITRLVVAPRATVGPRRPGPQSCSQWLIVQPQSVSVPHDLSMRYTAHASTAREQSVGCYEKPNIPNGHNDGRRHWHRCSSNKRRTAAALP